MFENREQAGELLAKKLEKTINSSADSGKDWIVIALLRGGIVLGRKISDYFGIPLFPLAVKKIGAPNNPELGIGAVTFDKTYYFNEEIIKDLDVDEKYQQAALETKYKEAKLLQKGMEENPPAGGEKNSWEGKNIIIVDDGVAIGNTVICASLYFKKQKVKKIILAIPVISKDGIIYIKTYFDRVVSLSIVNNFSSVSQFYKSFSQITDEEVLNYLV